MLWINSQLVPDNISIGNLRGLRNRIEKCKTIDDWKTCVRNFAIEHGLTDQEALAVANMTQLFVEEK